MFTKPLFHMAPNAQVIGGLTLAMASWFLPMIIGGSLDIRLPMAGFILATVISGCGVIRGDTSSSNPWLWRPVFKRVATK